MRRLAVVFGSALLAWMTLDCGGDSQEAGPSTQGSGGGNHAGSGGSGGSNSTSGTGGKAGNDAVGTGGADNTGGSGGAGGTGGAAGTGGGTGGTGGAGGTGGTADTVDASSEPQKSDAGRDSGGMMMRDSGGSAADTGTVQMPYTGGDCGIEPVTPDATAATRKVLCYLHSIYGTHILSGQEENNDDDGINTVFKATGKYPAIRAFDSNNSKAPSQCVDHWKNGGICMFGYHMRINGANFDQATNIPNVLTEGTSENKSFKSDLDIYASQVKTVQDAGGVAIIRLFHEAGKGCAWFWWSKGTSDQWQQLFKYAFNYLTGTKGIKNGIWISPLCSSSDAAYNPGSKYIDMGGADNYVTAGDYQPLTNMFHTAEKAFPNMMIALHENGSIPDPNQLKSTGTKWLFFNVWSGEFITNGKHNPTQHLKDVYSNDYVINRDRLPSFK